ncbi:MFS transporter [Streptacidiphilus sp. N1-12]|uniref:MFS transporter n=2 Tax=Streptacidiphilus alkalitolerans TaxID=3342712 RepID=A0ABV6VDB7_9ACTN
MSTNQTETAAPATAPIAGSAPEPDPPGPSYRWRWWILGTILVAEVMDLLDTTIVSIASPAIHEDFGGGTSQLQWIGAAYTLTFAVLLITGARLGDLVGRRRMFLIGTFGFTLFSALCAVSVDSGMLIGSRAVQGAFAALMIPQGLGIMREVFPPKEVGGAFAAFGPVMGLSSVLGPVLGGFLVTADILGTGWRMVFLINIPLGLAGVVLAWKLFPKNTRTPGATRLDLVGMVLLSAAVLLLIYPLVQGRDLGWPIWTYLSMAGSVPLFGVFGWYQRRLRTSGGSPLVEPSLFRNRAFTSALGVGIFFFAAMSGLMFGLTLMMQLGSGWTAMHAGSTMIPMSLGIAVGAGLSGAVLGPKYGRKVLHVGMLVMTAGVLGLWASYSHWGLHITSWDLIAGLAVTGLGMGLLIAPFFDIALAGVTDQESGSAAGVLNAVQQLGGSIGIAALGTGFFSWASSRGFVQATGWTMGCTAAALLVAAAVGFGLPRMARPEPAPVEE